MPWTDKQNAYFHVAAAGKAKKGGLSPAKAKELLTHDKGESQKRALGRMKEA